MDLYLFYMLCGDKTRTILKSHQIIVFNIKMAKISTMRQSDASVQEAHKYQSEEAANSGLNKQLTWLTAVSKHDQEVVGRARI